MKQKHTLEERIKNNFGKFSKSQRVLAKFLLNHYDQAAFLTANQLGVLVGVSESTVVRFAYAIDYRGWPDLQRELQEMVKNRLSTSTRLRLSTAQDKQKRPVYKKVIETDLKNLRNTLEDIKEETFNEAVNAVIKSEYIYILGSRSAHSLAYFLAFYLQMIGKNVKVVPTTPGCIFEELVAVDNHDLIIGISFPRYTRMTIDGFNYAQKKGARTLALTDSIISPLGQVADITLTAQSNIGSYIESFVAPLSVINALLTAVAHCDKDKTLANLDELEELAESYDVFYLPGGDDKI